LKTWTVALAALAAAAAAAGVLALLHGAESPRAGGRVVVCTAGSIAPAIQSLAAGFERSTGLEVLVKPMGSVDIVRMAVGPGAGCDLVVVADYRLIPMYLYPNYTDWYVVFASNRMVIAWANTTRPPASVEDAVRAMESGAVRYGISDPNRDPCGYRAVGVIGLLSLEWGNTSILEGLVVDRIPGSSYRLANGTLHIYIPAHLTPRGNLVVRPKSVELLALLESGELDYAIIYENEAVLHHLGYLELPPGASLGDPGLAGEYSRVVVHILAGGPAERAIRMAPIAYGLTVIRDSPGEAGAIKLARYILEHRGVIAAYGLRPLETPIGYGSLPAVLEGVVNASEAP
jgi:molybdate/tungstate transport system substrate-binding protein